MGTVSYLLLFGSVLLSGLFALRMKSINPLWLKLLLAFSGAYLFAMCVLHLIPETYQSGSSRIGLFILAGFILQLLLEFFSEGIEHGHVHIHDTHRHAFPFTIIFSLSLHSFLEGMPLGEPGAGEVVQNSLLTGIILHHVPVAMALAAMLTGSNVKMGTTVFCILLFAAMAPLGALTSVALGGNKSWYLAEYYPEIMALVIGIFLHISTTILFESTEDHRFNYYRFAAILTGTIAAIIIL
jgi:zinc and cadmium transporter